MPRCLRCRRASTTSSPKNMPTRLRRFSRSGAPACCGLHVDTQTIGKVFAAGFLWRVASPSRVADRALQFGARSAPEQLSHTSQRWTAMPFFGSGRTRCECFSAIVTAEFQITGIDAAIAAARSAAQLPGRVQTRVRYEIVGTGAGFHREQRVGNWDLVWEPAVSGEFRLRSWRALDETLARSHFRRSMSTSRLPRSAAILPTPPNCSMARTTGARCSTARPASTSTDTTEFRSPTSTTTASTISTSASLPACPIASIAIVATELSKTSRNRPVWEFWKTRPARCSPISTIDGRQDVIVVRANGPLLFLNEGGGKFRAKARRVSVCQPSAGNLHRRGRCRLRSRRLARHLFLPVRLLPGHRPIQISVALSRRGKRPAEFSDAQQARRHVPRRNRRSPASIRTTRATAFAADGATTIATAGPIFTW